MRSRQLQAGLHAPCAQHCILFAVTTIRRTCQPATTLPALSLSIISASAYNLANAENRSFVIVVFSVACMDNYTRDNCISMVT